MKEYIITLCAAALTVSLCNIILPEGNVKKYASLASSVIISLAIVLPLGNMADYGERILSFSQEDNKMTGEEAEDRYTEVLRSEYENTIEKALEKHGRVHAYVNYNLEVELIEIYASSHIPESEIQLIKENYVPKKLEVRYEQLP